jgi:hypothetical protein
MGRKKKRIRLLARAAEQATKTSATAAPTAAQATPEPPIKEAPKAKKRNPFKNLAKKTTTNKTDKE